MAVRKDEQLIDACVAHWILEIAVLPPFRTALEEQVAKEIAKRLVNTKDDTCGCVLRCLCFRHGAGLIAKPRNHSRTPIAALGLGLLIVLSLVIPHATVTEANRGEVGE